MQKTFELNRHHVRKEAFTVKDYLAIDIGGTFIKSAVVSEDSTMREIDKVKTPASLEGMLEAVKKISDRHPSCSGAAVSAPGAVSNSGVIYGSSAIPYIHGPNMREQLSSATGLPVYIENDANCAGYAEMWGGAAEGMKDVIVVVVGTGIGGAVIKDGLVHKGANLHGGEFGYMLVNIQQAAGEMEIWSKAASTGALVRKTAEKKGLDPQRVSGENVFEWAESGDPASMETVDEFYHLLALGIYNLQYVYDPEMILIGGGISAREDLTDKVNEKLYKALKQLGASKVTPNVVACRFRQNANLLGAVYSYKMNIENLVKQDKKGGESF